MFIGREVGVIGLKTRWILHEDRGENVILKGPIKRPNKIGGIFKCVPREKILEPERRCTDQEMQNG